MCAKAEQFYSQTVFSIRILFQQPMIFQGPHQAEGCTFMQSKHLADFRYSEPLMVFKAFKNRYGPFDGLYSILFFFHFHGTILLTSFSSYYKTALI